MNEPLTIRRIDRAFAYAEWTDTNNGRCSIQESSSALEPKLWLGRDSPGGRMHLDRAQVAALLPLLARFVEAGKIDPHDAWIGPI